MDDKPKEIIKDQPEWMLKSTVTGKVRDIYLDYHISRGSYFEPKKGMMQMISLPLVQIITQKMIGIVLELFNFAYQGIHSVGNVTHQSTLSIRLG